MLCNQFRDLMFERLAGELTPEQESACSEHELSCVVCRAELADTKWIAARLRTGWPAEESAPLQLALPQRGAGWGSWLDAGALWFTRASAALVMACLLALLIVRPTLQADRDGVRIAFSHAAEPVAPTTSQAATASAALTPEQVRALVQTEVEKDFARVQPTAAPVERRAPATGEVADASVQMRQLQRNQAQLWQQVQQHGLYLESLWRNGAGGVQPARMTQ